MGTGHLVSGLAAATETLAGRRTRGPKGTGLRLTQGRPWGRLRGPSRIPCRRGTVRNYSRVRNQQHRRRNKGHGFLEVVAGTVRDDRCQGLKWSGARDTSARHAIRFAANWHPRPRKWERLGETTGYCLLTSTGRALTYGRPLPGRPAGRERRKAGRVNVVYVQRPRRSSCSVKTSVGKDSCPWFGGASCRSVPGWGQGENVLAYSVWGDSHLSTSVGAGHVLSVERFIVRVAKALDQLAQVAPKPHGRRLQDYLLDARTSWTTRTGAGRELSHAHLRSLRWRFMAE